MLRLLIDENFDHRILRGLKSRVPEIDFVVVPQIGLAGTKDPALLKWAAENNRTLLTHDISTMVPDAEHLLLRGEPMFGVIVVPDRMPIGRN
jgi:predicted nuclease of predicted toxin-antitoxin system